MADAPKPSGGGGTDLMFFFGMMLLFFLVWVAGGGPSRPLSFSGPYLGAITAPGTTAQSYGDPSQFSSINGQISIGSALPAISFVKDASGAKSDDEESERVTIMVSGAASNSISTAGWKLRSKESGKTVNFPAGTELPQSGRVNSSGAITLRPGDQAIIVSGRSPVGASFRENMCTGYLEERQNFKPPLNQSCPTPYQELERFADDYSEQCASYVRSISYCTSHTNAKSVGGSCEDFVDEYLNYNGCVNAHRSDANFSLGTWRVFLGASSDLWDNQHDTIELLDAQGKIIDSLSY